MNYQIEIDNGSGFCFGVTTAIKKAEEELAKGTKLYCLGDIVHNGMECDRLKRLGLITINHDDMEKLHDAKVLLRAHGEPPSTYELVHAKEYFHQRGLARAVLTAQAQDLACAQGEIDVSKDLVSEKVLFDASHFQQRSS